MTFGISSISEARDYIRRRLMGGWVVVIGNGDAITNVEHGIYPPGTPKNADFEMVGTFPFVFLAKKTDELRTLCHIPDFDDLAGLRFHAPIDLTGVEGHVGWLVEAIIYDKAHGDKAAAIDRLVLQLTQQWGDLPELQQDGERC